MLRLNYILSVGWRESFVYTYRHSLLSHDIRGLSSTSQSSKQISHNFLGMTNIVIFQSRTHDTCHASFDQGSDQFFFRR